ncbi:MAG TPA: biopolymer transporter ExbD [Isosphaeraceae bacterium]|nr:biopolymer transporter ExbD [Isosphaeraceae bacterium]
MASWDVFHADRLELERGQSAQAIRSALARGDLRDDDLVRPAGTTVPWACIADIPELLAPAPEPAPDPGPTAHRPSAKAPRPEDRLPDFEEIQPSLEQVIPPPKKHHPTGLPGLSTSDVTFPVLEEPEPRPLRAPGTPVPPASSPAWVWAEDGDEDEDEEDDLRIIEDQGDVEILADDVLDERDTGSTGAAEKQPTTQPAVPGRSSQARSRRVESQTVAEPHDGWEPSEDDLDLDVIEGSRSSRVGLPVVHSRDRNGDVLAAEADDQPETESSLSRSATQRIEELDLAPMVDIAFQLVLFFMVTATMVLYKTLEIPKPSGEAPAGAVAQGRSRTLDDLKEDYILVEIDDRGAMKLDRQPIEPVRDTLVENLRRAREKTGRKAMLLSADAATLHRHAVLAYDAAHEIGLSIAIAKPKPPQGPAPTLRAAPAAAPRPAPNSSAARAAPL